MAVITDVELKAGFQVRVRWYAQGTQRYPSNENEYYSTFFTTLEPNQTFQLSDPRFVLSEINDVEEDLQYVIRDVCHTQTLVPQFVDFIYFNPDYETATVLNGRVNGGETVITVDANPDSNYQGVGALAAGDVIQIGPIQSDVYTIDSVGGTGNTEITLTEATTKTFPNDSIVALSDQVDGRYPDRVPNTALARILDNTGSNLDSVIQVTTALYYDIGETVRRYYYDSALQTPFNGARGSGETTNLESPDPRNAGQEIEAGWWSTGDTDNTAATEARLIDSEGYEIATRDREHAYQQQLYFDETRETAACTDLTTTTYVANHPDFTDTGFTSIRNDDGAQSIPTPGFYAWSQPNILVTSDEVILYFGDNQAFWPSTEMRELGGEQVSGLLPITFSGTVEGTSITFTIPTTATNNGIQDRWEIERTDLSGLSSSFTSDVIGWVNNPTTTSTSLSTQRFVRYWDGEEFDTGRVHATNRIDNCPLQLSNSVTITTYATEQDAACNRRGTSRTIWFTTTSGTEFASGRVTAIYTDRFGPNSDSPSALGTSYVRYNNSRFLWNGRSLSTNTATCTSTRYCGDSSALNFSSGDIRDDSLCTYARRICGDSSALSSSYVPPAQRLSTDRIDNSVCRYPAPPTYNVTLTRTSNNISGPSAGYRISTSGAGSYRTTRDWSVSVTVTLNAGYRWSGSAPTISYSPGSSGSALSEGATQAVTYSIGAATVEEIPVASLPDPDAITLNYATSSRRSCESTDSRTIYQGIGITSLNTTDNVYSDVGLTTEASSGYYSNGTTYWRYSRGSNRVTRTGTCPTPPVTFTVPTPTISPAHTIPNALSVGTAGRTFTASVNNPSNLTIEYEWQILRPDWYESTSGGGLNDNSITVRLRSGMQANISPTAGVHLSLWYYDPNTNLRQVRIDSFDVTYIKG